MIFSITSSTSGAGLSETLIEKKISELLPGLFDVDPPYVQGGEPIILTGSLLRESEVHFIPAGEKVPPLKSRGTDITLCGAFGSYGVLKRIAASEPSDYANTLQSKSSEVLSWIGSLQFSDIFDGLLWAFSGTRFGGARVTSGGKEAFVTLGDVVGLISAGKLSTNMSTDEVGSVPIAISKDRPIIEAIRKMVDQNVRRLFFQDGQGSFVSDRTLIDFMFSKERLGIARDHPEIWLEGEVSDVAAKTPRRCITGDLDRVARDIGPAPDDCLMTDRWRLVTRWDLAVKPWRARKLALSDS